jgi:hypothetical protein
MVGVVIGKNPKLLKDFIINGNEPIPTLLKGQKKEMKGTNDRNFNNYCHY